MRWSSTSCRAPRAPRPRTFRSPKVAAWLNRRGGVSNRTLRSVSRSLFFRRTSAPRRGCGLEHFGEPCIERALQPEPIEGQPELSALVDMGVSRIEQCARDSNGVANAESEPRVQLADE